MAEDFYCCLFCFHLFKNQSKNAAGQCCVHQSEERKCGVSLGAMAAAQVDAIASWEEAGGQMGSGAAGPERADGGAKAEEAEAPERTAKPKPEQTEGSAMSGCPSRGR